MRFCKAGFPRQPADILTARNLGRKTAEDAGYEAVRPLENLWEERFQSAELAVSQHA